jgi:hypothetical protein
MSCVFVPQVYLNHELRCVTRRDGRKRKKRPDLPFAFIVAALVKARSM